MPTAEMIKLASDLADAMLKSRETEYSKSWDVTANGESTGEQVVVVVFRRSSTSISQKAALQPAGKACPVCGGSGRV